MIYGLIKVMRRLQTICLILITLAILVSAGFYAWSVAEKQAYFERQEMKAKWSPGESRL